MKLWLLIGLLVTGACVGMPNRPSDVASEQATLGATYDETEVDPVIHSDADDNTSSVKVMRPEVLWNALHNTFGLERDQYPMVRFNDTADWRWGSLGGIDYTNTSTRPTRPTTAMGLTLSTAHSAELCVRLTTDDAYVDSSGEVSRSFTDYTSGRGVGASWEKTTQKIAITLRGRRASDGELDDVLELLNYIHGSTASGGLGLNASSYASYDANLVCSYFLLTDGGLLTY